MDAAFYSQLRSFFSDDEILDLGMTLGFPLGWQRFIEAFGIRPDGWEESGAPRADRDGYAGRGKEPNV